MPTIPERAFSWEGNWRQTVVANVWITKCSHWIEKRTQLRTPSRKFLATPLQYLAWVWQRCLNCQCSVQRQGQLASRLLIIAMFASTCRLLYIASCSCAGESLSRYSRGLVIHVKELISRLDSRTLPLEPRHRCTSSVLSTCLRNDVLASCLLTKHTPDDVIVTHALLYDLSIGPIINYLERLDFKVTPRRWI